MKILKPTFFVLLILLSTQISFAQSDRLPLRLEKSQQSNVMQVLGLDTIRLEFSRPNLEGRSLFGSMIPWGSVWRTGANASTKFEISEKMFVNGNEIPKGKYSLLSIPAKDDDWTIILNKNTRLWGHYGYKQAEDFLRFKVKVKKSLVFNESFNIVFTNTSTLKTDLEIIWGDLIIPLTIEVDKKFVDKRIEESIIEKINDPEAHKDARTSAHIYYFAAEFYRENNRDLDLALKWINKGIAVKDVGYFFLSKSETLGAMKKYKEAIEASKLGLAAYEKGTNEEWKWRYKDQIKKWEKEIK